MADEAASSKLLSWVFGIYVLGVSFSAIYFNWQYTATHGFVQWLFLGEIVPTAKSLIWPYYAFGMDQPSSGTHGGVTTPSSAARPLLGRLHPAEHDREAI